MDKHELLFCRVNPDLRTVLDGLSAKATKTIKALDKDQVALENEQALFTELERQFVVVPLSLHRGKMTREGPREVNIELRSTRAYFHGEDHVVVRGMEVTFIVPFDGDPWLFQFRPSSWTTVFPEGVIAGQEYRLTVQDPEKNADRVKQNRDLQMRYVEEYIRRQEGQINTYNESIMSTMKNAVAQRRKELQANVAFADDFDVPERAAEIPTPPIASPQKGRQRTPQRRRPKVFIGYAKQDAEKADKLFDELESAGADPWVDSRKLVHGDDWEHEIKKAVSAAEAFVVCLRPEFDNIGFRQKEIRWALDALKLRPPGRGFIIPFIIEPCTLPDWCGPIHAGSDISKPTTVEELLRAVEKHCNWTRTK